MELYRSTFRTILYDAIQERERVERQMGYTGDSIQLAVMREMLKKTEYEESTIYLKD